MQVAVGGCRTVVPKGTVCGNVNVMFLAVLYEFVLRQKRVRFNLVNRLLIFTRPLSFRDHMTDGKLTGKTSLFSIAPLIIPSICSLVKLETPMART